MRVLAALLLLLLPEVAIPDGVRVFARGPIEDAVPQAGTTAQAGEPGQSGGSRVRFALTVDSIMRGPALVGYPPSDLRWSGDSRELFFEWRHPGEDEPATWVVGREGGLPKRLSDEERRLAPPPGSVWDRARRRAIAIDHGDVVLVDTVARTRRRITRTTAVEANPRWTLDETHVTFTRDNNLFIVPADGDGDLVVQLTAVGPKEKEPAKTASQEQLEREEQRLIDAVREAAERRKRREERERREAPPKFELEERQSIADAMVSPDRRYAWLLVAQAPEAARVAEVPRFVTESAYTEHEETRTKVGDEQESRRLAILDLETGRSIWASLRTDAPARPEPPATSPHGSGARGPQEGNSGRASTQTASPAATTGPSPKAGEPKGPTIMWALPEYSDDGSTAAALVRSTDNKDRWIVTIEPSTGESRIIDHAHDDAWLRESGGFDDFESFGWVPDSTRVWFLSERDGWMHLYTAEAADGAADIRQLTSGAWEIDEVAVSPDRRQFLIRSNEADPGERHVYAMALNGGPRTRLTTATGASSATVSPDGTMLGILYSAGNRPPEVYLAENRPGAPMRQVTTSPSPEWRSYPWLDPKVITFTARDGAQVRARLYTPEMLGAKRHRSRPGVVFVHGAGYLQNAHRYWSYYYREYMFHHLLASRGYVVLDVDYRASAGYGRNWRTAIYRHMGGEDLEDVVDGARYLVTAERVHPSRIGVYGGSYGGFITLMAMFTTPDVFAAGAALRPVTDWAHYNQEYASSILNEPQHDIEAYRRSSPIYFAEGLKGALLICHGMVDTNVHFQDSVRLAQRLIELRKENWELAVYPVENHAFEEETSWADEYRRILRLFDRYLLE